MPDRSGISRRWPSLALVMAVGLSVLSIAYETGDAVRGLVQVQRREHIPDSAAGTAGAALQSVHMLLGRSARVP